MLNLLCKLNVTERTMKNKQDRKIKNKMIFVKKKFDYAYKAKPFIKWVGGKTQLIDSIEKALPDSFAQRSNVTLY